MSDATVKSRGSVFRRIFHALVGDDAPECVDPALHRRALWWAFSICAWVYSASFLISLPLLWLDYPWFTEELSFGPLQLLMYFNNFGPPGLFSGLLVPPLIYAVVLRLNRTRVPLAVLDLMAVLVAAYVFCWMLPVPFLAEAAVLFLMMLVLSARGHLKTQLARPLLRGTILIFFAADLLIVLELSTEWSGLSQPWLARDLIQFIWLPLSVALPIALMAKPNTPRLRHVNGKPWQLPAFLTAAMLIACAVDFVGNSVRALWWQDAYRLFFTPGHLGNPRWMVMLVVIVLCWWLLKYGAASREFLSFTVLVLVATKVTPSLLPPLGMARSTGIFTILLVGGVSGLLLATSHPFSNKALRAAGVIALGSMAVGTLHYIYIDPLIETLRQLYPARQPLSTVLMWTVVDLAALVVAVAAFVLAWWFVKPGEIEALLPWRRKREAESDVVSP